jgi:hypothetical protein
MLESILFLAGLVVVACCVLGGLFFCFGTRRTTTSSDAGSRRWPIGNSAQRFARVTPPPGTFAERRIDRPPRGAVVAVGRT